MDFIKKKKNKNKKAFYLKLKFWIDYKTHFVAPIWPAKYRACFY